jgi:Toprim-like
MRDDFRPEAGPPSRRPLRPNERANGDWLAELSSAMPIEHTLGADYLMSRGVSPERAGASDVLFGTKFFGRPAVLFPLQDLHGHRVGVHGRYLDTRHPRMRSAGNRRDGVFITADPGGASAVAISEAPIDALSVHQLAGIQAIALCGTSWPNWLVTAVASRHVFIAFDADPPGDTAAVNLGKALGNSGVEYSRLRPVGVKDWNEALQAKSTS